MSIMEKQLIQRQSMAEAVSSTAVWAMLSEAAVTPKPGLVDRANSGSHSDMDFFTLIDSAMALLPWFRDCALAGFDSGAEESSKLKKPSVALQGSALFESLRPQGRMAEVLMKKASGGVNTHRGYIFCLGLLCAAYGRIYRDTEKPDLTAIIEFTKAMTMDLEKDFSNTKEEASHGEAVYAKTGIQGIRGEVSRGFPSVTEHALPLLKRILMEGYGLNDAGVVVLLKLMAHAEDTNLIHRGGIDLFRSIQEELLIFFAADPDMEAIREKAFTMDRDFIQKNLSPGGCADLLGISFFLYKVLEDSTFTGNSLLPAITPP